MLYLNILDAHESAADLEHYCLLATHTFQAYRCIGFTPIVDTIAV
jgi:hypothetical protein